MNILEILYLFDEPTTGLHGQEIEKVLSAIFSLIAKGHTVIAIEHTLDFIAYADHIIEIGPKAGEEGGRIIFEGTPESLIQSPKSITGPFLQKRLKNIR